MKFQQAEEQVNENRRMYETLMVALKQQEGSQKSDHEQKDYLISTNKRLNTQLENMETRCYNLEMKNEKLKRYKNMVNNSSRMQCKFCEELFISEKFSSHLSICESRHSANDEFV